LQAIFRIYNKENKGIYPFVFGRDYSPDMSEEALDHVN
jgi:hypothetical protein